MMKVFGFKKLWLVAGVFAAVGFPHAIPQQANAETQSRSYFGRTTDPTPVDIAVEDKNEIVHFTIPKVFMTFAKNWDGGLQSGITLEVIYPSMAPVSATRNSMAGTDVVIINLDSFANNYNPFKLLSILIASQWTFIENVAGRDGRSYRLYINKQDVEKRKDESSTIEEFFVPEGGGIYLKCLRQLFNPHVGCSGIVNYGQNLSLNFHFRRSEFDKWLEIQKAVISLLNSFRQNTSQQ
jgi:hypothetical protein